MGINLLCTFHELMNYVFFQLYFSAVDNRDNVRLHRTDDGFLRFLSYVSDRRQCMHLGGGGGLFPRPLLFLSPWHVAFGSLSQAHNRMGKRRGLKLKLFQVSHIKKVWGRKGCRILGYIKIFYINLKCSSLLSSLCRA